MARVWELSQHAGTNLLMLLAIADFADDEARAYPSVSTLARKTRMTPRNVNHILAALRASGELEIKPNAGPNGTNRYRIRLESTSLLKNSSPPEASFTPEDGFTLKEPSSTPEAGCPKPLKQASDKPPVNHQEPPGRRRADRRVPDCDCEAVRRLYNASIPAEQVALPPIRAGLLTKEREKLIRARWEWLFTHPRDDGLPRAQSAEDALEWFRRFFAKAWENDHFAGRSPRGAGHENWRCDLDHLMKDRALTRVVEA